MVATFFLMIVTVPLPHFQPPSVFTSLNLRPQPKNGTKSKMLKTL